MSLSHLQRHKQKSQNAVLSNAVVPSTMQGICLFIERLLRMLSNSRFAADEVFAIRLAVEEALLNAVIHGNQLNPAKEVHVMFTIEANDFGIRIQDEGTGFNPDSVSDPTYESNAGQLRGRGLLLMHHSMDAVRFNAKANVVTLTRSHRVGRTEHAHQPHSTPGKATLLQANEIAPTNSAQLSPLAACLSRARR